MVSLSRLCPCRGRLGAGSIPIEVVRLALRPLPPSQHALWTLVAVKPSMAQLSSQSSLRRPPPPPLLHCLVALFGRKPAFIALDHNRCPVERRPRWSMRGRAEEGGPPKPASDRTPIGPHAIRPKINLRGSRSLEGAPLSATPGEGGVTPDPAFRVVRRAMQRIKYATGPNYADSPGGVWISRGPLPPRRGGNLWTLREASPPRSLRGPIGRLSSASSATRGVGF